MTKTVVQTIYILTSNDEIYDASSDMRTGARAYIFAKSRFPNVKMFAQTVKLDVSSAEDVTKEFDTFTD